MDDALQLRLGALFAILASSFVGVAMPKLASICFKSRMAPENQISYFHIVKLLSATGCGCILATALCHIAPEANERLSDTLGEYPSAFAIATAVIIVLYIVEHELNLAVQRHIERRGKLTSLKVRNELESRQPSIASDPLVTVEYGVAMTQQAQMEHARAALVTHILEIGVAMHSVIIGVAFGMLTEVDEIRPLFIALIFHQFCEGSAIGASVLESQLTSLHTALLWALFVVTTPLGIAIGIAVERAQGSDPSYTSTVSQGTLESIATGILLYMGLIDIMPSLFSLSGCGPHIAGEDSDHAPYMPLGYRFAVYICVCLGAGAMILIAKWV